MYLKHLFPFVCAIAQFCKCACFSVRGLPTFERRQEVVTKGWTEDGNGEWNWVEDDPNFVASPTTEIAKKVSLVDISTTATPKVSFRPKQSLGQNYLKDPNTVAKIIRAFHQDATRGDESKKINHIVELGPGTGALTNRLVESYGASTLDCIEIDERAISVLHEKHPKLRVKHEDVLQIDYPQMADELGHPLNVIGNLPYYITSQILFALADASHFGAISTATVTMQWEVAQRMVAPTSCKDYGILSVVFQIYADVNCHFKIPPTVFYPQPKVDSALIGLHFVGPKKLRQRLSGVRPEDLRLVITTSYQQRRKTIRNSLKKLVSKQFDGDMERTREKLALPPLPLPKQVLEARESGCPFALSQELAEDWATKRPEQLTPGQFIEVTRLLFGSPDNADDETPFRRKVWRKLKHG